MTMSVTGDDAKTKSPLTEIRRVTQQVLELPVEDVPVVDYIVSILISTLWSPDADPLWGWIIGPPGCYKTEIIRPMEKMKSRVTYLSSMTEHALVSGFSPDDDSDPSLLPKLDKKVLVIQDFTAMLGLGEAPLKQIFADLRAAFDGSYAKAFGTAGTKSYKSKFGIIAAVTPEIDDLRAAFVTLGERFLAFRVAQDLLTCTASRIELLTHVEKMIENKGAWRKILEDVWVTMVGRIVDNFPDTVTKNPEIRHRIILMSDLLARIRALPMFDESRRHAPLKYKVPEFGSRLVNQLSNLCIAHAIADGRDFTNESDFALVRRVGIDTLPPAAWRVIWGLYRNSKLCRVPIHVQALSERTGMKLEYLVPILKAYCPSQLVVGSDATGPRPPTKTYVPPGGAMWRLTDDTIDLLLQSQILQSKDVDHPSSR